MLSNVKYLFVKLTIKIIGREANKERWYSMKVFIGSSTEALNVADKIALYIESMKHDPIVWNEPDVFVGGKYLFECLEEVVNKVDAAIFVFSGDDEKWYRDNKLGLSVKGNVLMEYGFFRGVLGRNNVLICTTGNPHLDSDIDGVVYVDLNAERPRQIKTKIETWLNNLSKLNYIDPILLPNGEKCLIEIPSHYYGKGDQKFTREQDVNLVLDFGNLLRKQEISFNDDGKTVFGAEIRLGSPTISHSINRYIKYMFPDFQWYITDENFDRHYNKEKFDNLPNPQIRISSNNGWEGFKFNGKEFEYKHNCHDWAFLLRLGKEHFPEEPKTIYALFGIGECGRKAAAEYFIKNHTTITEKFGSNDYLLAAKVNFHDGKPEMGGFQTNLLSM